MHIPISAWVKRILAWNASLILGKPRSLTDAERYVMDGMPTVCRCGKPFSARAIRRAPYNIVRLYCPMELNWWEGKEHDFFEWGG